MSKSAKKIWRAGSRVCRLLLRRHVSVQELDGMGDKTQKMRNFVEAHFSGGVNTNLWMNTFSKQVRAKFISSLIDFSHFHADIGGID